jgi:hypothetical protein
MLLRSALLGLAVLAAGAAQMRDNQDRNLTCDDRRGDRRLESFCEIREYNLPASGRLEVDGRQNGGITVKGWRQGGVLVRAKVHAQAATEADARSLVSQVRVDTAGNQVRADGPSTRRREYWVVSYEIFVPHRTDLSLRAHNGGIGVSDVYGRMELDTVNGGLALNRLAGSVRGRTVNGGLSVQLEGDRWDGEGLDAQTTNGGVAVTVPDRYSARLETGTVNGGMNIDFPVTVQGNIGKRLSVQLGSGGATVRAVTTNGGVSIRSKSRSI